MDGLTINTAEVAGHSAGGSQAPKKPLSLFDSSINNDDDSDMIDTSAVENKFDHLPSVPVPRYLQTPSQLPPLFPFSRTTVYILLSDATPEKRPKSVILKGTSRHGPLELEIPITELAEKDSTIHCLAARKEIKELEEGRGWLAHAKDYYGKLLKEKYDGRFTDMVEKEAVRLGVRFQVGGKWCSFVAVEDDEQEKDIGFFDELNSEEDEPSPRPSAFGVRKRGAKVMHAKMAVAAHVRPASSSLFGGSSNTGGSLFSSAPGGQPSTTSGLFGSSSTGVNPFGSASRRQPGTGGGLFGSSNASGNPFGSVSGGQPSNVGGLFGAAPGGSSGTGTASFGGAAQGFLGNSQPPIVQAAALAPPAAPVDEALIAKYQSEMDAAAAMPLADVSSDECEAEGFGLFGDGPAPAAAPAPPTAHEEEAEESDEDIGFCLYDDGPAAPPAASYSSMPVKDKNPLEALTSLQTFSGSWSWSADLERVLGVKFEEVTKLGLPSTYKGDILATACAILFFKLKLKEEEDVWEMLVEKAEGWLEDNIGEDGVKELEIALQKLF
ncbi:hypothetical protein NXS19_005860 [Fusarium pseudograminearum]|nr:hypothetical protein NXS19_005860 [Fusarium pseudograminearum]